MLCGACEGTLTQGRLFCVHCGEVTPEGERVMSGRVGPRPLAPAPRAASLSASAVVSLAFGVLSYVALPLFGALVAVVAGHHARREISVSGGRMDGMALATTGLVLGYVQLALIGLAVSLLAMLVIAAIVAG